MADSPPRMEDGTDAALIAATATGDRVAFAALFRRFGPRVRAFHLGLGATPAQADDLLQEVMVTIWRKAESYDPAKAAVSTWIFTIARNRYIDVVRKIRRIEAIPEVDEPDAPTMPDDELRQRQSAGAVATALKALPPEQRGIIELAYLKELTHSEIAAETGLPLGTVKSRIRLAMERLRPMLEFMK